MGILLLIFNAIFEGAPHAQSGASKQQALFPEYIHEQLRTTNLYI